jgi:hypothetical protein
MRSDNKPQNPNIDFSKVVSTDDLDSSIDIIRGVGSLLRALELSADSGSDIDIKCAYYALWRSLDFGIKEIDDLKKNIEYMDNFIMQEIRK